MGLRPPKPRSPLESHLEPGRQAWRSDGVLEYGVSITDACIGWEEAETLLYEAASDP